MAKKNWKEKFEQLTINEAETLKVKLAAQEEELFRLRVVNASLQERLRLVKIAATEGE